MKKVEKMQMALKVFILVILLPYKLFNKENTKSICGALFQMPVQQLF